jgi:hypothetical protein
MSAMDGLDWYWVTPAMLLWIVIFGVFLSSAVRLAMRPEPRAVRIDERR